jgi:hypothetical protein
MGESPSTTLTTTASSSRASLSISTAPSSIGNPGLPSSPTKLDAPVISKDRNGKLTPPATANGKVKHGADKAKKLTKADKDEKKAEKERKVNEAKAAAKKAKEAKEKEAKAAKDKKDGAGSAAASTASSDQRRSFIGGMLRASKSAAFLPSTFSSRSSTASSSTNGDWREKVPPLPKEAPAKIAVPQKVDNKAKTPSMQSSVSTPTPAVPVSSSVPSTPAPKPAAPSTAAKTKDVKAPALAVSGPATSSASSAPAAQPPARTASVPTVPAPPPAVQPAADSVAVKGIDAVASPHISVMSPNTELPPSPPVSTNGSPTGTFPILGDDGKISMYGALPTPPASAGSSPVQASSPLAPESIPEPAGVKEAVKIVPVPLSPPTAAASSSAPSWPPPPVTPAKDKPSISSKLPKSMPRAPATFTVGLSKSLRKSKSSFNVIFGGNGSPSKKTASKADTGGPSKKAPPVPSLKLPSLPAKSNSASPGGPSPAAAKERERKDSTFSFFSIKNKLAPRPRVSSTPSKPNNIQSTRNRNRAAGDAGKPDEQGRVKDPSRRATLSGLPSTAPNRPSPLGPGKVNLKPVPPKAQQPSPQIARQSESGESQQTVDKRASKSLFVEGIVAAPLGPPAVPPKPLPAGAGPPA